MTFSMLDDLFTLGDRDFSLKAKMKPGISRLVISCSYIRDGSITNRTGDDDYL